MLRASVQPSPAQPSRARLSSARSLQCRRAAQPAAGAGLGHPSNLRPSSPTTHCTSFRPTKSFPSPQGKAKESGCEPELEAARSSDPRAADQHARLVVELCCNPSQVTFVFSENPACSARLLLVHGKGEDHDSDCSSFRFHFILRTDTGES